MHQSGSVSPRLRSRCYLLGGEPEELTTVVTASARDAGAVASVNIHLEMN
jgi:hypothetical protein